MKFTKFLLLAVVVMAPCVLEGWQPGERGGTVPAKWAIPERVKRWSPEVLRLERELEDSLLLSNREYPLGAVLNIIQGWKSDSDGLLKLAAENNKKIDKLAKDRNILISKYFRNDPRGVLFFKTRKEVDWIDKEIIKIKQSQEGKFASHEEEKSYFRAYHGELLDAAEGWMRAVNKLDEMLRNGKNDDAREQLVAMREGVRSYRQIPPAPTRRAPTPALQTYFPMIPVQTGQVLGWQERVDQLRKRLVEAAFYKSGGKASFDFMIQIFQKRKTIDEFKRKNIAKLEGWYNQEKVKLESKRTKWKLLGMYKKKLGDIEIKKDVGMRKINADSLEQNNTLEQNERFYKQNYKEIFDVAKDWYEKDLELRTKMLMGDSFGGEALIAQMKTFVDEYEESAGMEVVLRWRKKIAALKQKVEKIVLSRSEGRFTLDTIVGFFQTWDQKEVELAAMEKNNAEILAELEAWKDEKIDQLGGRKWWKVTRSYRQEWGRIHEEYKSKKDKLLRDYNVKKSALDQEKRAFVTGYEAVFGIARTWYEKKKQLYYYLRSGDEGSAENLLLNMQIWVENPRRIQ